MSPEIRLTCEVLERKDRRMCLPYESDADKTVEEIVEDLMEITALSLTDLQADRPSYKTRQRTGAASYGVLRLKIKSSGHRLCLLPYWGDEWTKLFIYSDFISFKSL